MLSTQKIVTCGGKCKIINVGSKGHRKRKCHHHVQFTFCRCYCEDRVYSRLHKNILKAQGKLLNLRVNKICKCAQNFYRKHSNNLMITTKWCISIIKTDKVQHALYFWKQYVVGQLSKTSLIIKYNTFTIICTYLNINLLDEWKFWIFVLYIRIDYYVFTIERCFKTVTSL